MLCHSHYLREILLSYASKLPASCMCALPPPSQQVACISCALMIQVSHLEVSHGIEIVGLFHCRSRILAEWVR